MSMPAGRQARFQRNSTLEARLAELSELLAPAEAAALARPSSRRWPVVLVVGAPRSGTTLLVQWLAASGALAYPTNLLSRFHAAPAIGARIQELLCNPAHAHGEELAELNGRIEFESDLGKTRGVLAPHEFWYFWRRFLPTVDIEPLGPRAGQADWAGLRAELQATAEAFAKPFACKGMMLQYDLPLALEHLPEAVVLFVQREPEANARSLLRARERFFGDPGRWYSAKPPEYDSLKELSPHEQVAGQVRYTNEHILAGLEGQASQRWLRVRYEDFCADPAPTWAELRARLADANLPERHPGPASFHCTNP